MAPLARDGSFFGAVYLSGKHAESVDEIVWGKADGTAIDCVSYELLRRVRPRRHLRQRASWDARRVRPGCRM